MRAGDIGGTRSAVSATLTRATASNSAARRSRFRVGSRPSRPDDHRRRRSGLVRRCRSRAGRDRRRSRRPTPAMATPTGSSTVKTFIIDKLDTSLDGHAPAGRNRCRRPSDVIATLKDERNDPVRHPADHLRALGQRARSCRHTTQVSTGRRWQGRPGQPCPRFRLGHLHVQAFFGGTIALDPWAAPDEPGHADAIRSTSRRQADAEGLTVKNNQTIAFGPAPPVSSSGTPGKVRQRDGDLRVAGHLQLAHAPQAARSDRPTGR